MLSNRKHIGKEIKAMVLFLQKKLESQPTHADNFSHEGKKDGKVGLPM